MTNPRHSSGRSGATRDTGAVRDEHRRRFPLWLLLLGLLVLLLVVAGILIAALSGGSKKKVAAIAPVIASSSPPAPVAASPPAPAVVPSATPPAVPIAVPTPAASTSAAATSAASSPAVSTPAAATPTGPPLVGGADIAPAAATDTLAAGDNEGTVLFAENSSALTANAKKVISDAASRIKATRPPKIVITGYTDMIAGQPTNLTLSKQRATKVESQLHNDVGPGLTAYSTNALGEKDPVATNATADGRQRNRRATITTD